MSSGSGVTALPNNEELLLEKSGDNMNVKPDPSSSSIKSHTTVGGSCDMNNTTTTTATSAPTGTLLKSEEEKEKSEPPMDHTNMYQKDGNIRQVSDEPENDTTAAKQQEQKTSEDSNNKVDGVSLPNDLIKILQVVAKTGVCPWLPWEDATVSRPTKTLLSHDTNTTRGASTKPPSSVPHTQTQLKSSAATKGEEGSHDSADIPMKNSPQQIPNGVTTRFSDVAHSCARAAAATGAATTTTTSAVANTTAPSSAGGNSSSIPSSSQIQPQRKKHRNGIHKGGGGNSGGSRIRFGKGSTGRSMGVSGAVGGGASGTSTMTTTTTTTTTKTLVNRTGSPNEGAGNNRKRPHYFSRTNSGHASGISTYQPAPGSVGSGRTSGSEVEDSGQCDWDSEGTSATTNSEFSVSRKKSFGGMNLHGNVDQQNQKSRLSSSSLLSRETNRDMDTSNSTTGYTSLQMVLRIAIGWVLDHFYRNRGGYVLSPMERRVLKQEAKKKKKEVRSVGDANNQVNVSKTEQSSDSEDELNDESLKLASIEIFHQRREGLLQLFTSEHADGSPSTKAFGSMEGAPFTIQRIAEVLLSPDRYYTQTHKLCNCLEKLLLVKLPTDAFGGSTGGVTSKSRREQQEMAALALAKGKEESRLRQRRLKRRTSSPTTEMVLAEADRTKKISAGLKKVETALSDIDKNSSPERKDATGGSMENEGYFPSSASSHPALANHGDSNDSTDESSRELLEAAARASLRTKFDHVGIDPHANADRDVLAIAENRGLTNSPPPPALALSAAPTNLARVPSPILFPAGSGNSSGESHLAPTASNMQIHQLQHSMAMAPSNAPLARGGSSPLDLMTIDAATIAQMRSQTNNSAGSEPGSEGGRSSASNSDIDSESDDVSFDDSASDRSDGSDTGPMSSHPENMALARAMYINRQQQQQQQRMQQSRVRTSLASIHQNEGFRPPADSEYQSGDSIDSTRAEDSEGSDSSDMAD